MNATTAYAFAWMSTAFAVSVAVASTGRLAALWAMLIPAMISLSSKGDNEDKQ